MDDQQLDFQKKQFSFPLLRAIVAEKDRTVRTWHQRYFPDFGEKNVTGKYLFSGAECIAVRMFADCVTKMAIKPETAKSLAFECLARMDELLKMVVNSDPDSPPEYKPILFVIEKIGTDEIKCVRLTAAEIFNLYQYSYHLITLKFTF